MANTFGTDILIQAPDAARAAAFYVEKLGFTITDHNPGIIALQGNNIGIIALQGNNINLFIEPGPPLGPILEVTVANVEDATRRLVEAGCTVVKHEPEFPRTYIKDPFGLIYNLTT